MTLAVLVAALAAALLVQALFSLWLMLYTWNTPERVALAAGPSTLDQPKHSFTVLLPARDEAKVIGQTIRTIRTANYPAGLLDIVVICHEADTMTIQAARTEIDAGSGAAAQIVTFGSPPINKPHALNVGLRAASGEVVCVFDAEDDVHRDLLRVIDTVIQEEDVNVVQGGVQLMNYTDRWFSIHNCLEYFFWFRSRLHFHAERGVIPLGGNTVFFRRFLLNRLGGWDQDCLTEDADIGMRLSAAGERIRVVYDCAHVTREETPDTVRSLIRQRTRWHQGFLQVLGKRDWARLPGWRKRALAFLTFAQPLLDAVLFACLPFTLLATVMLGVPVPVAMFALLPLYAAIMQLIVSLAGAVIFMRTFHSRVSLPLLARMALTHFPYQWLLGISAMRAVGRQIRGNRTWEKTRHTGAHRHPAPISPEIRHAPSPATASSATQSRGDRTGPSRRGPKAATGVEVATWLGTAVVLIAGIALAGGAVSLSGMRLSSLIHSPKK